MGGGRGLKRVSRVLWFSSKNFVCFIVECVTIFCTSGLYFSLEHLLLFDSSIAPPCVTQFGRKCCFFFFWARARRAH